MDLSTTYLGLRLPHPLMPGASPLVDDLDVVCRLEDAGAAALVVHSLFEEQFSQDTQALLHHLEIHEDAHPEARTYLPWPETFSLGPNEYLEHLRRIKARVGIPVIASLNGTGPGRWLDYARSLEQAGADALELNIYYIPTDPQESPDAVEDRVLEALREVKSRVRIPVAVKLHPFYTSVAHLARRLVAAGADGLVLFNRFYEPDIDPEALEAAPTLALSSPVELRLRLQWTAILSGRVETSLALCGGVYDHLDAIKAVMAGAHAVQMVSALLREGPEHLRRVREAMEVWLRDHEYESLEQMQGSMNLARCPDPGAFERGHYIRILQSWRAGQIP